MHHTLDLSKVFEAGVAGRGRGENPQREKNAGHQLRHVGYVAAGVKTGGSVESLWVGLIWSEAG